MWSAMKFYYFTAVVTHLSGIFWCLMLLIMCPIQNRWPHWYEMAELFLLFGCTVHITKSKT